MSLGTIVTSDWLRSIVVVVVTWVSSGKGWLWVSRLQDFLREAGGKSWNLDDHSTSANTLY